MVPDVFSTTEEEVRAWVLSQDPSAFEGTLEEIWQQIRNAHFYAGQPRSTESKRGVSAARVCLEIATNSGNGRLEVQAWRMLAYTLTADERYEESLPYYEQAIHGLEAAGNASQSSRARLGYIAALFHTGRYREALVVGAIAEDWFKENNDEVGYARLCNNIANLYDRLDEHAQAYQYHLTHSEIIKKIGDQEGLAISYLNLGNSLASMDQFEKADEMYKNSEDLSGQLGITELWAQASYNRGYLHYLRGRYSDAFQSFSRIRQHFERSGSRRHYALCDLDEAEIYIQLNLAKDAVTLAERAAGQFKEMGFHYEEAKATAFLGLALFQMGRHAEALEVFQRAEHTFESEGNLYWKGLLDVYRAEIYLSLQRNWEAHELALQGKALFEQMGSSSKTILSLVLLGRIALALNDVPSAEAFAAEISALTEKSNVPLLLFPCFVLCGSIAERKQEWDQAARFYEMAAQDLEQHEGRLHHDDLKVTFAKGKQRAYEALVWLALQKSNSNQAVAAAYMWSERAKSRGLVDLLSQYLPAVHGRAEQSSLAKIERLREELNVLYVRSKPELRAIRPPANFERIGLKEDELARSLREVSIQDPEYTSLQQVSATTIENVQEMLSGQTTFESQWSIKSWIAVPRYADSSLAVAFLSPWNVSPSSFAAFSTSASRLWITL